MSNNFFDKIKESLMKSKEDINKIKEKLDPELIKTKMDPLIKNIKENNDLNKQTAQKLTEKFNYLYSNKFKEMDKFVGSNSFWQTLYKFKNNTKQTFSSLKSTPLEKSKSTFKDFFSFKKTFFFGSIKTRLRNIALKLLLIYLGYLGIKIVYHRTLNKYTYGSQYETMKQLEELKRQNDEIIKRNRELLEENRRYRGY